MTKRARLRDELRRLGSGPVPVLDPARAQRLEWRVLDAARPRELELVEADSLDPRRTSRRRSAVIALVAACLLAVIVIGSLDRTGSSERILFASGDVEVVLPDGSVVAGANGMTVPDGAILRLGPSAEAEVDGVTVSGAGDYRVTRDGLTLLTAPNPSESSSPPTTDPDAPSPVAAGAPAVGAAPGSTEPAPAITVARPTTTARVPATTVVRPTTTASDSATTVPPPTTSQRVAPPPPVNPPEPRPTEPLSPTTSTVPTTTPPTTVSEPPNDGPAPLDVTIRSDERGVVFAWRPVVGAAGYVVAALPAVGEGAGSWPPAPGVEVTELNAGTLQFRVARPTDGAWSYRIAAVARDGRTLALSRVFTIES